MHLHQKKAQNRGKDFERTVARALNTTRVLRKGTSVPDILYNEWKIDCKHRRNFPAFSGYHSCREKYGENTVVILCQPGRPYRESVVLMGFDEWKELMGD